MIANEKAGEFSRLHSLFTFHLGVAVALSWLTAFYASFYAPWVRNIRPLIDPSYAGQVESTWSFLFVFPAVLTVAWLMSVSGREVFRQMRIFKNQAVEFAIAGALAFVVFYLAIDRAVAVISLGL